MAKNKFNNRGRDADDMTADELRGKLGSGAAKDSENMSGFDINELLDRKSVV